MMFRTENLGQVAGPTIELKDNNMGLTQRYDSKQFILVAKCSKGYILMNRMATEEMYLRLCVGLSANAIVAQSLNSIGLTQRYDCEQFILH
jgi:hypothetical protein